MDVKMMMMMINSFNHDLEIGILFLLRQDRIRG